MGPNVLSPVLSPNTEQPHEHQDKHSTTILALNVMSINVCGLKSKLIVPEFCDFLKCHDVNILCETKCDDLDIGMLEDCLNRLGFVLFLKNRESCSKHRSGGVLVAIKKQLAKLFTSVDYVHNFMLVLKGFSALLGLNKNSIIVAVYIPPMGANSPQLICCIVCQMCFLIMILVKMMFCCGET